MFEPTKIITTVVRKSADNPGVGWGYVGQAKQIFRNDDVTMIHYIDIIRPNRINLPSPRSQSGKYEWEKGKISSTGGEVRADLFYWDCLLVGTIPWKIRKVEIPGNYNYV